LFGGTILAAVVGTAKVASAAYINGRQVRAGQHGTIYGIASSAVSGQVCERLLRLQLQFGWYGCTETDFRSCHYDLLGQAKRSIDLGSLSRVLSPRHRESVIESCQRLIESIEDPVECILLTGSHVIGTADDFSDIDLLVISEKGPGVQRWRWRTDAGVRVEAFVSSFDNAILAMKTGDTYVNPVGL